MLRVNELFALACVTCVVKRVVKGVVKRVVKGGKEGFTSSNEGMKEL